MKKSYLDLKGLSNFLSNLRNTFAPKAHKHTKSDITDFPSIPTKTSHLVNDSGFKTTDNNTTYTLSKSGATITLTGSDGSKTNVVDSNTTYDAAGASLGLVKTGGDVTIASGVITVNDDSHNHIIGNVDGLQSALDGKANVGHNHDDRYYTESEIDTKLNSKANTNHTHTIDSSLSSTSTNPVQNKVINSALDGKVPTSRTINNKPLTSNITLNAGDVGADASGTATSKANEALTSAKQYTDSQINAIVGEGAATTLDTIGEISKAIQGNQGMIETLNSAIGSKANSSDLTSHTGNTTVHITSAERSKWNNASTHAGVAHAPANAEVNQNAFSNVIIGSTTISADTKTDTLTLVGSNVTLTPDASNDKVTIGITKANVTNALGYTPPTTDTKYQVGSTSYLGLTKLYATTGSAVDGTMTQSAITNALNGKANATHNHSASQVTQDTTHRFVTDNEKGLWNTLSPVVTSGTGSAYTVNMSGITSLKVGMKITIVPHVNSDTTTPTLNLNGLGAKQIRMPIALNTSATSAGIVATWLLKDRPVTVEYDGMYWKTISMPRVPSQYLYGTVPITQGGTGATTAEQARINIGAAKIMTSSITINASGWELEKQSGLYRIAISNGNVKENDIIDINLDHLSILEGENCELKCTESYLNGFYLYAKRIPSKQMTGTLVITRGV